MCILSVYRCVHCMSIICIQVCMLYLYRYVCVRIDVCIVCQHCMYIDMYTVCLYVHCMSIDIICVCCISIDVSTVCLRMCTLYIYRCVHCISIAMNTMPTDDQYPVCLYTCPLFVDRFLAVSRRCSATSRASCWFRWRVRREP